MASVASADSAFNPSNPLAGVYSPKTSHLSIVQPMLDQYQQQQQQQPQSESKYKKKILAKNVFLLIFEKGQKRQKYQKVQHLGKHSNIICLKRIKSTFNILFLASSQQYI